MTRPDIHAAAITLAALPESDARLVVREVESGSETSLRAALEAQIKAEREDAAATAAVPPAVLQAGLADTWNAAVGSALRRPEAERTLDVILPAHAQEIASNAEAARTEQSQAREEGAKADAELRRIGVQLDYELGKVSSGEDFVGKARRYRRLSIGLFAVEAAGIYVAVGAAFGLGDGMPLSMVPSGTWLQILAIGTLASVALFAATFLAVERVVGLRLGVRFQTASAVVAVATALLMAVALGVIRWWGSQSATQVSAMGADLGSVAMLVVVALASAFLALASAWARHHAENAEKEAEQIAKVERRYGSESAGPVARKAKAEADLARLTRIAHLPLALRTAFEGSVKQAEEARRADAVAFESRLEQALGAFRLLRCLPPELRILVPSEVFILRHPEPGESKVGRRSDPRRSAAAGASTALGVLLMGVLLGCGGSSEIAPDLVVACDGTGGASEDVCTNELLMRRFAEWAQTASFRPGATFSVVLSAGSYGATLPVLRAVVPMHWAGRAERPRWMAEQLLALSAVAVPTGPAARPGLRTENLSDLVSLISVASREARRTKGPVEFLLATDGWLVSLGVDTEADAVPAPAEFLSRLRAADVPWDLSIFSRTVICGLHNRGAVAGKVAARDRLLTELFRAGSAAAPEVYTTCRDLYPAVPAGLQPSEAVSFADESSEEAP